MSAKDVPVQYRYVKDIYTGDKRMELNVVPDFSVRMTPPLAVFPAANAGTREIHVSVTNSTKRPSGSPSASLWNCLRVGRQHRTVCRSVSSTKMNRSRRVFKSPLPRK